MRESSARFINFRKNTAKAVNLLKLRTVRKLKTRDKKYKRSFEKNLMSSYVEI